MSLSFRHTFTFTAFTVYKSLTCVEEYFTATIAQGFRKKVFALLGKVIHPGAKTEM